MHRLDRLTDNAMLVRFLAKRGYLDVLWRRVPLYRLRTLPMETLKLRPGFQGAAEVFFGGDGSWVFAVAAARLPALGQAEDAQGPGGAVSYYGFEVRGIEACSPKPRSAGTALLPPRCTGWKHPKLNPDFRLLWPGPLRLGPRV